ncbi:DNA-binding protein [Gulbenkiania mobilis]|uniref:DNA-binding protein n=1 Tax=Gulbenkiania mobilis TaxID=397457 RepID=UPI0006BBC3E0|nr:DNA-binding protein [Gulbenkiania mobilis]
MSDTRARTREAALKLLSQGIYPSAASVREIIGFGSNGTINSELTGFLKSQLVAKFGGSESVMPAEWTQEKIELFEAMFAQAEMIERRRFEEDRRELMIRYDNLRAEVAAANQARSDALQLVANIQQQLAASERICSTLEASLAHERELAAQGQRDREQLADELDRSVRENERISLEARETVTALTQAHAEKIELLTSEHRAALQAAKDESERREQLAYERFEATRTQLMEETHRQREEFQIKEQERIQQLARQRIDADAREEALRKRLSASERSEATAVGEAKAMQRQVMALEQEVARLTSLIAQLSHTAPGQDQSADAVASMTAAAEHCDKRLAADPDVPAATLAEEIRQQFLLAADEADNVVLHAIRRSLGQS